MKTITCIVATLALSIISANVYCAEHHASMQVSAYVVPAAKYEILHQENSYTITGADISKGYVDINTALVYSVWTNSKNGYLLKLAFNNSSIKEIKMIDRHNSYLISNEYQEVHIPHPGQKYETKELGFRLYLLADAKPGTYTLPVAIGISAM